MNAPGPTRDLRGPEGGRGPGPEAAAARRHARARALPLAWLGLVLAGCDAIPAGGPPNRPAPPTRPADPRANVLDGRPRYGLSQRAAYFALADTASSISKDPSPFRFADIREASGIDFVHVSGMDRRKLYPTAFGSGVAMFDYDGDGRLDLYFATCTPFPPGSTRSGPNRLFKNLGGGRFRDATDESGLGFAGFCHGIIAGDIDNDGDTDVFLCNYGPNVLYLNNGDGTFRDISHSAGVDKPNWSSGGAMLDYDGDGDLDIYIANYGDWQFPRDAHRCGNDTIPLFCSPWDVRTTRHILYRNNGDGTFTDVTERAGVGRADGHGFGVVAAHLNGDGRIDLYVANDMNPNFLFLNRGDGTFEDATEASGAAFDERGLAQSSMGVDAEDCDGDGRPELFVTNFQNEHIAYYLNRSGTVPDRAGAPPSALFAEESAAAGLVADSKPWVGWGCALADFDGDGWPDAFVANGHIDDNRKDLAPTLSYPEPPLLYHNVPVGDRAGEGGGRRFALSTRDVGSYFAQRHVARGAAFGDLDDDGDIDIVVNHMDGPPALLRNDTPRAGRWIRLKLVGTRSNRDAIGALVRVTAGGRTIVRQRKGGCSMQSTNDPRLLIGLGAVDEVSRVIVRWPSGATSILEHLPTDRTYEVVEPL
jgi:enediyne biosynthesis protein E4